MSNVVDISVITQRKRAIRNKVRRASPALVYSSETGIHIVAPHRQVLQHFHRVYRILDRLAFIPRGTLIGCKRVAEHAVVQGEREGLSTSRGYVFAEQIAGNVATRLSHAFSHYWEDELPVEGILVKVGACPEEDEMFVIEVSGDYHPFSRAYFLGSVDKDTTEAKKEPENLNKLQEELTAAWQPGAGFSGILDIYRGLSTVTEHPSLRSAFDAPRVEQVLLDRSQVNRKNWRAVFQRQS